MERPLQGDPQGTQGVCNEGGGAKVPSITLTACLGLGAVSRRQGVCCAGLGSPIFPSGCEGKLGVALESLQGLRDLT